MDGTAKYAASSSINNANGDRMRIAITAVLAAYVIAVMYHYRDNHEFWDAIERICVFVGFWSIVCIMLRMLGGSQ